MDKKEEPVEIKDEYVSMAIIVILCILSGIGLIGLKLLFDLLQ